MAETALADGMLPLADDYASRAVSISQNDPRTLAEALSFLGKLAFEQGRSQTGEQAEAAYAEAEEHYRRAAQLFEVEQNSRAVGHVLGSLGRLLRERGRTVDAVDALQAAINRAPGDLDLRLDLARALSDSGQAQAAISQYGSLLTIAPDSVEAMIERAAISVRQADPAAALADLDNAVRLDPEVAERPDVVTIRSQARAQQRRRPSR
jgi:tetratricopeptide (TPR) repeat protein